MITRTKFVIDNAIYDRYKQFQLQWTWLLFTGKLNYFSKFLEIAFKIQKCIFLFFFGLHECISREEKKENFFFSSQMVKYV